MGISSLDLSRLPQADPFLASIQNHTESEGIIIMAVLGNPRHEAAARVRATGGSAEDAAAAAGYDTKASSFSANARKLIQRPDIQARIAELQGELAAKAIEVTAEWIKQNVARIACVNVPVDEIGASHVLQANKLLAELIGALAPQKIAPTNPEGTAPYDPNASVTDEQRIEALMKLLAREKAKGES